jgi:D-glycero-beta-D-manno-heptose 1-phosphate adenylyltransferase
MGRPRSSEWKIREEINMGAVFTNGCFDVLHVEHFNLLIYCREIAGAEELHVAVDSDEKIKRDKGHSRPIFSLEERIATLRKLRYGRGFLIDKIHVFDTNDELHKLIENIRPEVIVKGTGWKGNVVGSDICEVIMYPSDLSVSSTNIVNRIVTKSMELDFRNEVVWSSKQPYIARLQCTCSLKADGSHADDCYGNNHMKELYKK